MSISHLLEDFGSIDVGTPVALTDVALEEQKLNAFEKGYQAGWEDAVQAAADDTRSVSSDLAQNLRDLTFTYEEAHQAALAALKPLLDKIVSTVLPTLAQNTLGLQVSEQLHDLARAHGNQQIEIVAASANIAVLEQMLGEITPMSAVLIEEDSLAGGQVHIRFGHNEREIDLNNVITAIEQAITGFYSENQKESA